ncbi:MAG: hypothetical protein AAFR61_13710 [Bacteroidota bacterium]
MHLQNNRTFGLGFILIMIAGGLQLILENRPVLQIVMGGLALVGFVLLMTGIYQERKKEEQKKE